MPERDTEGNAMRCGACGAHNYPFASFCIGCGEPFETSNEPLPAQGRLSSGPADNAEARPTRGERTELGGLGRRETFIGIALLLIAMGFAVYQWHRADEQSAAYRAGIAAEK